MAWGLRELIDPSLNPEGWYIEQFACGDPADPTTRLRDQLAPIPLLYDPEGRIRMLPKNKRAPDSTERTLVEIIGHSPDEFDAVILGIRAMRHGKKRVMAGAV